MSPWSKAKSLIEAHGPAEGVKRIGAEILGQAGQKRDLILLAVDLTAPKNRLRDKDRGHGLKLHDFGASIMNRLLAMLEREAPDRIESVETRFVRGAQGFACELDDQITGFVFWVEGSDDPHRLVHPDLAWLKLSPKRDEVYTFDYFVPEALRGKSGLFVRAVQEAQFQRGFKRSYGYVLADNRGALWLYRTTGWTQIGRLEEFRLMRRLSVVGDETFWIHPFHRTSFGASGVDTIKAVVNRLATESSTP